MALFFYLFASLMVLSSILVISSSNPVYSVLWLIFAFCNASGLMVLMGAEFLAMMLIVIYVGAVAVLFLFVIMMLDIRLTELKSSLKNNLSISILVAVIMLADLIIIIMLGTQSIQFDRAKEFVTPSDINNIYAIGNVLYTDFILPFQAAGIILFVAMIACIALTLRYRTGVKRQNIRAQLTKTKENSLTMNNIKLSTGVDGIKYDE
jgi:NADH-quinone oxidoreductase subunit J